MRPLLLTCIHLLNHKRTLFIVPWQINFLKNLWGDNLVNALENPSILYQPHHPYLHTRWFLKTTKTFARHAFSLQSLVLSYFFFVHPCSLSLCLLIPFFSIVFVLCTLKSCQSVVFQAPLPWSLQNNQHTSCNLRFLCAQADVNHSFTVPH